MRRIVTAILTSVCAVFLACSDCCPINTTVTYVVEGIAHRVSVEFNDDYGEREYHSSIGLPWVKKFTIKFRGKEYYGGGAAGDYYEAYLSATTHGGSVGTVSVSIFVDGKLAATATTFADKPTATVRYAVRI